MSLYGGISTGKCRER